MCEVLKRTVSLSWFFWVPATYVLEGAVGLFSDTWIFFFWVDCSRSTPFPKLLLNDVYLNSRQPVFLIDNTVLILTMFCVVISSETNRGCCHVSHHQVNMMKYKSNKNSLTSYHKNMNYTSINSCPLRRFYYANIEPISMKRTCPK